MFEIIENLMPVRKQIRKKRMKEVAISYLLCNVKSHFDLSAVVLIVFLLIPKADAN